MDHPPLGRLLQQWRRLRRKSQLDLSNDAQVSPRHLAFVETGRARPSREMVLCLATALDVPLRERNALLVAAGFAPIYRETDLDAPELALARRALDHILRQQEPHPAIVLNRRWDVVVQNQAAGRFFGSLLGADAPAPANVLRLMFHPRGLRPHVVNWEEVAEALIQRVHREAVGGVPGADTDAILAEALGQPGVPERWRTPDVSRPLVPLIALEFATGGGATVRYFSTVTTLGTPQDITLQELRIECFHPA